MKRNQLVIATFALLVAACGGVDAVTTAAATATGDALVVASTDLGDIVTDPEGATLYIFMPDEQGDPTCFDDCATNWPPLTTEFAAGEGLDDSMLGLADRGDGSMQLTYNGWPLYYFAADSAPGDINGQGVGDIWWVIGPDGEPITG